MAPVRAAMRNTARAPAMSVPSPASSGWRHDANRRAAASSAASRLAPRPSTSADAAAAVAARRDSDDVERAHGLLDGAALPSASAIDRSSHSKAQNGQVQAERADPAATGGGDAVAVIAAASPQG